MGIAITNEKQSVNEAENESKYGFTDEAATEDKFGITDYIGGLADFIEQCNTPLTLSIQGSWGTGKTSIMNLVKNELSSDIVPVWFNTWQFSQFNMDDQLAVSLLSSLISEFKIEDEQTKKKANKLVQGLRLFAGVSKDLAFAYIDHKIGGRVADMSELAFEKAAEGVKKAISDDYVDPTVAITGLREQFAECVQKTLSEQKKDRIVIFIDDLDRLEPRKAVELLEVLKIFLDCKNCVFVLAIDYDVVCRGVAAKYGSLDDDAQKAAEKGKSFFDKIIQVPFKMPVARYNISAYVKSCFEKIGIKLQSEEELQIYVDLIKYSIGTNPRSMKRLFNAYQLLRIVVPNELLSVTKNQQLLFAILCLQYCSEPIYNFMIRHANPEELTMDVFGAISECKYEDFVRSVDDPEEITDDDFAAAKPFMGKLFEVVDTDGENGIDEDELQNFIKVLGFSAITSAADTEPVKRGHRSPIVDSYSELDMGTLTVAEMERIVGKLKSIAPDAYIQLVKGKSVSHIVARIKNEKGPVFADVYERKNGFNIDCFVPSADVYTDREKYPDIVDWIDNSKYKPGKVAGGRRLSPAAYNQEEEENLMKMVSMVYQVWKAQENLA